MRVMMIVWIAAMAMSYAVAGRSIEQALIAGKVLCIGFFLGFVGAKLSAAFHAYREAQPVIAGHRR